MSVDGGTISLDTVPTPRVNVSGNTTITGGTIDWRTTTFTGNMLISGGTVTWTGSHFFGGDYTRTAGTVNTTSFTTFQFIGNTTHAFTVGAGGIALRFLQVDSASSQVLNITGDITINKRNGASGSFIARPSSTTNLDGTLTLNPGTELSISGSLTTLNVLDGSVVDAVSARSYRNDGMINEIGTGVVLRDAAGVGFTESAGTPVGSVPAGSDVFITLFDEDENIDGLARDMVEVTVQSLTTGDVETITLSETGNRSEEFRNTVGLPTATGVAIPGDGILQQDGSEDLRVSYVDNEDPGDMISNNLLASPIVWDGGGVDNNWDTPENWTGDLVPTAFDSVRFDGTSSKDAVVTLNQAMFDFTMTAGYAGTVANSGDPSLTINGQASIEGGTFTWTFATLRIEGNLAVSGGMVTMGSFGGVVIGGTTTITGGTVNWHHDSEFTGNVLISGGTVTWGRMHNFFGDYTRTGGTVITHTPRFDFKGNGPQVFTIGAAGIDLRRLTVSGGGSQVLDIIGGITIRSTSRFDGFFSQAGTTNLDSRLTLNSGGTFSVLGSSTTFNVLDGAVLDATAAGSYINEGVINEIGTGKVLRFTTGVGLTESTGMIPVNKIDLGAPIFLLLFDEDENIDGTALDFAQITLTNMINGDFETVTLTERGVQSEDFFFAAGFPTAVGTAIVGNGILEASLGNVIEICYQDDEDPADRLCVFKATTVPDCNGNGVDDLVDIAVGTSQDCDSNLVPDECQLPPIGDSPDCNNDQIPDLCQIMGNDCNNNGIPDDCESFFDCNLNGVADACDLFDGISLDCNLNGIPDECDLPDCDGDGIPDECEPDCDNDGIPDDCEADCNGNGIPEDCETFIDCNLNGIPDECDIAVGTSADCNGNNIPDGCEIADGSVPDCNSNGIPDGCDIDPTDPDGNGLVSPDINGNGIPDECDNKPPVCDAGGPYPAECSGTTTSIALDGSGSSDPNPGDTLTYSWSTDCPGGSFDDNTLEMPTLMVNSPPPCPVSCHVSLTVDDGAGAAAMCTTSVTITDSTAPLLTVPSDVMVCCVDSVDPSNTGSATATDNCDAALVVTFSDSAPPSDLSSATCPQIITRTWIVSDDCGNTTTVDQLIEQAPCCGNAVIEGTEHCDGGLGCTGCVCDVNFEPTIPLSLDCQLTCSNGSIDPGEECDDGNTQPGDGCDENCRFDLGACCVSTACSISTVADCMDSGGSFFGFNSTCNAPDADGDGLRDECDECPNDPGKTQPGICGCGVDDNADADGDGVPDCDDTCPGVDDAIFGPCDTNAIPAVSQWGMIVMALLLLIEAKVYVRRRRTAKI